MTRGRQRRAASSAQVSVHGRREFLAALAMTSGAAALGAPAIWAQALANDMDPELARHARDWAWLVGNWDVQHRRLRERLAGSNDWDEFGGKSALWLTLGGSTGASLPIILMASMPLTRSRATGRSCALPKRPDSRASL